MFGSETMPRRPVSQRYLADYFDVRCAGAILGCYSIDNPDNVALKHTNIIGMSILAGMFKKMFDEIHDIGPCVHRSLRLSSGISASHVNA